MEIKPEKLKELFTVFLRTLRAAEGESLAYGLAFEAAKQMPENRVDLDALLADARKNPQLETFLQHKYDKSLETLLAKFEQTIRDQHLIEDFLKTLSSTKWDPNQSN